jgi:uncharacterized membrane protein YgcG
MFSKLANMPRWHHHGCGGTMSVVENEVRCSICGPLKTSQPAPVAHSNGINNIADHSLLTGFLLAEGLSMLLNHPSANSGSPGENVGGFGGGDSGGGGASADWGSSDSDGGDSGSGSND